MIENKTVKRYFIRYELLVKNDIPVYIESADYSSRQRAEEESEKVKSRYHSRILNIFIGEREVNII